MEQYLTNTDYALWEIIMNGNDPLHKAKGVEGVESSAFVKYVASFGSVTKLNQRYIGPIKILAKVGTVAYRIELPDQLSRVHRKFHVSNLKKCLSDETLAIPLDEIQINDKLHFVEELVKIMDRKVKRLKQIRIPIMKVRWNSRIGPEFTWEHEDQIRQKYPHLFINPVPSSNATT
ncbi:hypothetical protein Tco_0299604 [Tanacetum coccineum]